MAWGMTPPIHSDANALLARKMVEKGVRFVQLFNGSWDSHDYIERAHGNLVRGVDQPIAALIQDLKARGPSRQYAYCLVR